MKPPPARHAPRVARLFGPIAVALAVLAPSASMAQVAPVGGHHLTTGPAAASANVSPSGAYTTAVPLDLPAGRGSIPIPLSVVYNGSSRVGTAGAGWDVPLSFVRRSRSTMRRKPGSGLALLTNGVVAAERVLMSLGGGVQHMVPTSDPNVYRPAAAHSASELRYQPDSRTWQLVTSDGLRYWFAAADTIAPASQTRLADPELYYLTEITRVDGRDRLVLDYEVRPGPELNLLGIRYSFQAGTETPLYDVRLVYRDWTTPGILSSNRDSGYTTVRSSLLDRVDVFKRDVFRGTSTRRYRSYSLGYEADADTGAPRLSDVRIRGEEGVVSGPESLPIAHYTYGRVTAPDQTVVFRPDLMLVGGDTMANEISASTVSRQEYAIEDDGGILGVPRIFTHDRETTSLTRLTHDFTGDGLPDHLYKSGNRWHMVYSVPTVDGGVSLHDNPTDDQSQTVSWREPAELSVESVFNPDHRLSDSSEHRYSRYTETWVTFLDWNGDGRTDVLDARDVDWTVWINEGVFNDELRWRQISVSTADQREQLEERGYDLVPEAQFGIAPTYWLPIARSRSGPRIYWNHCEMRTFTCPGGAATCDANEAEHESSADCPDLDGIYNVGLSGAADTWREWSITDTNGDSFPDFTVSSKAIGWCDLAWGNMRWEWQWDIPIPRKHYDCREFTEGVQWNGPGIYQCKQSTAKQLWPGSCPSPPSPGLPESNPVIAFLNAGGALSADSPYITSHPSSPGPDHVGGLGLWTNAESSTRYGIPSDVVGADYRDTGAQGFEVRDLRRSDDGLYDFRDGFRFESDRDEKCRRGRPNTEYFSRQLSGEVDINGDGFADRIEYTNDRWWVSFRSGGTGLTTPRELVVPGGFSLSVTIGTCDGDSRTVEGVLDLDGDGRPEHVRVADGVFTVSSIMGTDAYLEIPMPNAHGAGRLVAIENGYGARTRIDYDNTKLLGRAEGRGVPNTELVVGRTWVEVAEGAVGRGIAPTFYFYQAPAMAYDQALSSFDFAGYLRMITVSGLPVRPGSRTIAGTARVVRAWAPTFGSGTAYHRASLRGLPKFEYLLEGEFELARMPWLDPEDDPEQRLRAFRAYEYDIVEVSTLDASRPDDMLRLMLLDCGEVDAETGERGGDGLLCSRAGIIYTSATTAWEGGTESAATDPLQRVETRTEVTEVDGWARPLRVRNFGDTGTSDDDTCRSFTYASPTGDVPFFTAVHALRTDDCGIPDTSNGVPKTVAGTRFVYDGLTEGTVGVGRLSRRILERYDVSPGESYGALLEEIEAERVVAHDVYGNPLRVERPRARGIAATQVTNLTYDVFGASLMSREVSSTDLGTVLRDARVVRNDDGRIAWKVANGDTHVYYRDNLGRFKGEVVTPTGDGAQAYFEMYVDYNDTIGNRHKTVQLRPGATPSDPGSQRTFQRTFYDAIGRPVSVHDYVGESEGWVGQATLYDAMGRASYVTAPATVPSTRYEPAVTDLPYGTTFFYSNGGEVTATVDGHGMATDVGYTDVDNDRHVASRGVTYRNGLRAERFFGPGAVTALNYLPTSSQAGQQTYSETLTNGSGWVVERTRGRGSSTWFDRIHFDHDRLGRQVAVHRHSSGSSPTTWRSRLDSLGNELERTEPGTSPITTTYDEWGAPLESRWAEGDAWHTSTWTYDGLGRPQEYRLDLDTPVNDVREWTQHYYYDTHSGSPHQPNERVANGALSWIHVPGVGDEYYTRDSLTGRSTSTTVHADENIPYRTVETRSGTGRLHQLSFQLPGRTETVAYHYDAASRLRRAVLQAPEGSSTLFDATEIDELGRYRDVTLGNGARETFVYDASGPRRLRSWAVDANEERFERIIDHVDADGRMTWLRQIDGQTSEVTTWHYDYDRMGRLTGSEATGRLSMNESFSYDELGNLLTGTGSVQYGYDGVDRDRLSATGPAGSTPTPVQYDAAGNVTAYTPLGKPSLSLSYDGSSRIAAIRSGNGDSADFTYGPGGGLLREDLLTGGIRTQRRHYGSLITRRTAEGGQELIELSVQGPLGNIASLRRQPVTAHDYSSLRRQEVVYTHGDGQANRLFTDSNGNIAQKADYRAYGAVEAADSPVDALLFTDNLWNGGDTFANFGIARLGVRLYDPTLGRFLQRDPIRITAASNTANPYAFAWNDPINRSDPAGLSPCSENPTCGVPPILVNPLEVLGWLGDRNGHRPSTPPPPKRHWLDPAREAAGAAFDTVQGAASGLGLPTAKEASYGNDILFAQGQLFGAMTGLFLDAAGIAVGTTAAGGGAVATVATGGSSAPVTVPVAIGGAVAATAGTALVPVHMANAKTALDTILMSEATAAEAAASAAKSGPALAGQLGTAGEAAAGIVKNTERIASVTATARYRTPDVLDHVARVIGEVKNVAKLTFRNQLRDFAGYAKQRGYTFELWVRPSTQLSGPLQQAVGDGQVVLRFLP
jgi:RHS repeat-associated protein